MTMKLCNVLAGTALSYCPTIAPFIEYIKIGVENFQLYLLIT